MVRLVAEALQEDCRVLLWRLLLISDREKIMRFIDLFAGIGGIRLGFERAFPGSETVFVSEQNKKAVETYRANFPLPETVHGDITQVEVEDVPEFDICLAGFPCQAFSMAGKRKGFEDDYKGQSRGTLFAEIVRICEARKPRVIFCENVKGLLSHDRGATMQVIVGAFEQIGYKVHYTVLNSKDLGVPQHRERVYIVCFREDVDDSGFTFPGGKGGSSGVIEDILDPSPIPSKYYLSDVYLETLREHRRKQEAKGNGFGYVVRDLDGIAGACVCGGMGRERNLIVDSRPHSMVPTTSIKGKINGEDIRKMTPREWARLQGFPDDFVLPVADSHLYAQLGNSVTVPVIEAIALRVKNVLNG